jgi:hypothetical protein
MNPKKKSRRYRVSVSIQALDLAISRFTHSLAPTETQEGWPLLALETEANGDSWEYLHMYERGPSLVVLLVSLCSYIRFLSCLVCPSQPSTKYYFPRRTFFHFISPYRPATWTGSRAGSPVSESLSATTPVVNTRQHVSKNGKQ